MERESFNDPEVAETLNRDFIPVKVDREERPDVDHIYMNACMAMNGAGGWPLSCFLTPDKKPFIVGTYFPKNTQHGIVGFVDILAKIADMWKNEREKFNSAASNMMPLITETHEPGQFQDKFVSDAYATLRNTFDEKYGGFGSQPKFPSPHKLMFLLRANSNPASNESEIVRKTLRAMAEGGIRDHIGGGFFRYSTERRWLIPHFEKMLYDNAMLLMAYVEASLRYSGEFDAIASEIADFVLRDLMSPEGAFYTAWDADSEGVEGKFYLFTPMEIDTVLGETDGARFSMLYDITRRGNFENKSIPNRIGRAFTADDEVFAARCREQIYAARSKREQPFRDEKALLSMNGLMIAALSCAGRALGRSDLIDAAVRAAEFCVLKLRREGRLYTSFTGGKRGAPGALDTYSFFIWGLLELYRSTFDVKLLKRAIDYSAEMEQLFAAPGGGLYYSAEDISDVPVRTINSFDNAIPSGQSVAAMNYCTLFHITGDTAYRDAAGKLFESLSNDVGHAPPGYCWLLSAFLYYKNGGTDIVLTPGEGLDELLDIVRRVPLFCTVVLSDGGKKVTKLVPHAAGIKPDPAKAAAYVCENGACSLPITEPEALKERITGR